MTHISGLHLLYNVQCNRVQYRIIVFKVSWYHTLPSVLWHCCCWLVVRASSL